MIFKYLYNEIFNLNQTVMVIFSDCFSSRLDGSKNDARLYFYCPNNCGRKYKHKCNLNQHLRYECGVPKNFVCNICNKAVARKSNLKSHMVLKHGIVLGV